MVTFSLTLIFSICCTSGPSLMTSALPSGPTTVSRRFGTSMASTVTIAVMTPPMTATSVAGSALAASMTMNVSAMARTPLAAATITFMNLPSQTQDCFESCVLPAAMLSRVPGTRRGVPLSASAYSPGVNWGSGNRHRKFACAEPKRGSSLARAADGLDASARGAGHLADLAVLRLDEDACRGVAVQAAEIGGGHFAVRGLRAVLVDDVEQHKAVRQSLLSLGHEFQ